MQEVKKQYQECISGAVKILASNGFDTDELTSLSSQVENYKVIIPVVGMFSVGKSRLLNTIIGRDILPVDNPATTCLATELHFSTKERIEAFKLEPDEKNNIMREVFIEELPLSILRTPKQLSSEKYSFIKLYLDNAYLENNQDVVLVDMPGLDSGIKEHDKAIRQYLRNATNYFMIERAAAGTLTNLTSAFIREINSYGFQIFGVINKIDLPGVNEAVSKIADDMRGAVPNIKIAKTSALNGNIDELINLLGDVDCLKSLEFKFSDVLMGMLNDARSRIQQNIECTNLDASEIEEAISGLEAQMANLQSIFEKEKERITSENLTRSNNVMTIKSKVKEALTSNAGLLLSAAQMDVQRKNSTGDSFNAEVNSIVRPVLLKELGHYAETEFEEVTKHLKTLINNMNAPLTKVLAGITNIQTESINPAQIKAGLAVAGKTLNTLQKSNAAFKTLFAPFAIMTSLIPGGVIAEVIIFFLPEIINFIASMFGVNSQQQAQLTENDILNKYIPQILKKLGPEIEKALNGIGENMLKELNRNLNEQLSNLRKDLTTAKKLKDESVEKKRQEKEGRVSDVQKLSSIIKSFVEA